MNIDSTTIKLDIACGQNKKNGFIGVDIWPGADIIWDLSCYPWPFEDCSVDEIYCSHFIEHVSDLVSFMNELYRIMKVGAQACLIAPYYTSVRAWQDPTHVRNISEVTFWYFNQEWRTRGGLDHYPITTDFDFTVAFKINTHWKNKPQDELDFAVRHYFNVVDDIHAFLTKTNPEVRMAVTEWEAGNYDAAIIICRRLLTNDEGTTDIYLMLAEYAYKNGELDDSLDYFLNSLDIDGNSLQAYTGLIRVLVEKKNYVEARKQLDKLKSIDSEHYEIVLSLVDLGEL